jgi:metalloendopeptidase OMA1, mitochondrial
MNPSMFRLLPVVIGLGSILFFVTQGCKEGPFGRKQLVNVTPAQELNLGRQAYQQVLKQSKVVDDREELPTAVRQIGDRLAEAAGHPKIVEALRIGKDRRFEWEYHVVVDKSINAFCLPGGKVVVNTGIIDVADTETGLAVVMGHEIGHALARHGVERMSRERLNQLGISSVAGSFGRDLYQAQAIASILGAGVKFGVSLPFSRDNESEADRIGLMLMAVAGYDPREGAKFWIRMNRASGNSGGTASFASTHPSHEQRQRDLEIWADSAEIQDLYRESRRVRDRKLPRYQSGSYTPTPLVRPKSPSSTGTPDPKSKSLGGVRFE